MPLKGASGSKIILEQVALCDVNFLVRVVISRMFSSGRKNIKVLRTVINRIFVDMMDNFGSVEKSAKNFFCNKNMLTNVPFLSGAWMVRLKNDNVFTCLASASFPVKSVFTSFTQSRFNVSSSTFSIFRGTIMGTKSFWIAYGYYKSILAILTNSFFSLFKMGKLFSFLGTGLGLLKYNVAFFRAKLLIYAGVSLKSLTANYARGLVRIIARLSIAFERTIKTFAFFDFVQWNMKNRLADFALSVFTIFKHKNIYQIITKNNGSMYLLKTQICL